MEDKKISEAAKALVRGAKMLPQHCPECKLPLFQEGERVYCPSCGKDAVIVTDDVGNVMGRVDEQIEQIEHARVSEKAEKAGSKAEDNIKALIDELSTRLLNSSYSEMREILDIMLKAMEILERLKR